MVFPVHDNLPERIDTQLVQRLQSVVRPQVIREVRRQGCTACKPHEDMRSSGTQRDRIGDMAPWGRGLR